MKSEQSTTDPRCSEIRPMLPGFKDRSLGVVGTGETQGHLLTCEGCSEIYAEMLLEEAIGELESLPPPPLLPPTDLYDNWLRARSRRIGTLWSALRAARDSDDARTRERARAKMEQIGQALSLLAASSVMTHRRNMRTRGVRTRGRAGRIAPVEITAHLLSAAWEPTGQTVLFILEEAPHIAPDGHFRIRLRTIEAGYENYTVFCCVELEERMTLSFSAPLARAAEGDAWVAYMDEEFFDNSHGNIPLEKINLSLATAQ